MSFFLITFSIGSYRVQTLKNTEWEILLDPTSVFKRLVNIQTSCFFAAHTNVVFIVLGPVLGTATCLFPFFPFLY